MRSSRNPPVPIDQIAAYLNFDMVGRMQDNRLIVQATGTSPVWGRLLERANVAAGFDLVVQPDPVSADRRRQLQPGGRAEPRLLHRFARGLPQAVGHRRQDQLRRPRPHRRRWRPHSSAIVADTDEAPQFTKVDQPASRGEPRGSARHHRDDS